MSICRCFASRQLHVPLSISWLSRIPDDLRCVNVTIIPTQCFYRSKSERRPDDRAARPPEDRCASTSAFLPFPPFSMLACFPGKLTRFILNSDDTILEIQRAKRIPSSYFIDQTVVEGANDLPPFPLLDHLM